MAYTINANAKNVWIRDNEDTRDLSIQTDASSVYLENGRTLEQELGEGSMVSNVTTVDSAMSKVIDGTLDGAYESCVLKGRTLVNVLGSCKFSLVKTEEGKSVTRFLPLNPLIKPNTKYLYVINVLKNTLTSSNNGSVMKYCETDSSKVSSSTCWEWMNHIYPGFTGVKKHIMTTKPVFEGVCELSDRIEIYGATDVGGVIEFETFVVEYQEGMENWDIPYFEGMCDVKMPILHNVGKNLLTREYTLNSATLVEETNEYVMTKGSGNIGGGLVFTPNLTPNKTYSFSVTAKTNRTADGAIRVYNDTRKEYINVYLAGLTTQTQKVGGVFTVPSTHQMGDEFKIWIGKNTDYDLETTFTIYKDWQLEESSSITTHEDYKSNILRTSEEIVLREVGGVYDTYNVLTGEYTQRIGEGQFCGDGLTAYAENETYSGAYYLHSNSTSDSPLLSPTMKNLTVTEWKSMSCEGIYKGSSGIGVVVNTSKLSQSNLTGLKAYFTQNPVTFQYQLAEPITTIVKPSTIPFAYENGHIILESGSEGQSLLPTLEYSTVVNRTGQVESVAKTIQTQEKQLTMLEQMLVQNIIGLDYNNTVLALNLEINEVM